MSLHKLSLFALSFAIAGLLTSCSGGSSSSSSPSPALAPAPASVDPSSYDDAPGQFSGRYTGTCVIKAADRTHTNCSTIVRIEQKPYMIMVRTTFFLNGSSRSNDSPKVMHHEETFTITGKVLSTALGQPQVGIIGRDGFYFTMNGQPYHFVRLYPNNYEYSGTYSDDSGRSVSVLGRVARGAVVETSEHRTRK
jgi:hypothetical protein